MPQLVSHSMRKKNCFSFKQFRENVSAKLKLLIDIYSMTSPALEQLLRVKLSVHAKGQCGW